MEYASLLIHEIMVGRMGMAAVAKGPVPATTAVTPTTRARREGVLHVESPDLFRLPAVGRTAQHPDASQRGSPGREHDELLFIVIHQIYELWFKQILHEMDHMQGLLRANQPAPATHTTRRILAILKTVVAQLDILETMTPLEFNAFRGFLESSSGFQSAQFREIEFVCGYKRDAVFMHDPDGSSERARLAARYAQPTLWDAFLRYLQLNDYPSRRINLTAT